MVKLQNFLNAPRSIYGRPQQKKRKILCYLGHIVNFDDDDDDDDDCEAEIHRRVPDYIRRNQGVRLQVEAY